MISSVTALKWLQNSQKQLGKTSETPRLDSMILLEDRLGIDRAKLLAHPEYALTKADITELNNKLSKRLNHEPMSYIRSTTEFYGRTFFVDSRVLIPRPESEAFIDELKTMSPEDHVIADIGTGSGVLGISAALEFPGATVNLYDISSLALEVARINMAKYGLALTYRKSDLLKKLNGETQILLANLPYIPTDMKLSNSVEKEPSIALKGGQDGLDIYRKFWQDTQLNKNIKIVMTESLPSQHKSLEKMANLSGFRVLKINDFVQVFGKIG